MIKSFYSGLLATRNANADNQENKRRAGWLSAKFLVKLFVSLGILAALLVYLPTDKLLAAFSTVPAWLWLTVISGFIVGHIISALKWKLMLAATGTIVASGTAIRAHGAGLFANLCLPSIVGGDFVRAALVIREQRSNFAAIALGSLADRLNDTFALVLIAGCASLWLPANYDGHVADILSFIALALLAGAIGGILFARLVPVAWVPGPFKGLLGKINQALDTLFRSPLTALCGLALSVAIQGSFIWLNIMIAAAMNIEASATLWFFAWPMAKLIALAPISVGGIGVREVAIAAILAPFGIEASLAVAQSLCWEVVLVFSGLMAGLLVAIIPAPASAAMAMEEKGDNG